MSHNENKAPADRGFALDDLFKPSSHGMTLRDWFAGQALAGFMACENTSAPWYDWAGNAYRMADAMLAARAAKKEAE